MISFDAEIVIAREFPYIMSMLEEVQFQLEHLSKSGHKVAEAILASPDNAIYSGIATLALEANVSEPMVSRFCRNMDTCGLPDFKFHLVQSLANDIPYANRDVDEDDSVGSYAGEIFKPAVITLDRIRHSLDKSAINHIVGLFAQTKKITFFGLDSSTAVAHDVMGRFFRFSIPIVYSDNIVLQHMSCMSCSDGDMVVLISYIGRTKNLVELARLTRGNNAMVIVLTSVGIPFVREVVLAATLDVLEDTDIYMPMVSRLAQSTIIDMLATGFTLQRNAKFRDNLKRAKEALKGSRFSRQLLNLSNGR